MPPHSPAIAASNQAKFAITLAGSPPRPVQNRVAAKNIVYFDLETQRSFGDVGGFAHKDKMQVSVGVTYSTARGTYEIYAENEMEKLGEELVRADLVVGWNHLQRPFRFDGRPQSRAWRRGCVIHGDEECARRGTRTSETS